jgi:hypothetical protein
LRDVYVGFSSQTKDKTEENGVLFHTLVVRIFPVEYTYRPKRTGLLVSKKIRSANERVKLVT